MRNTKLQINLALNYGSKKELVYAFNKLKKKTKVSENDINNSLYTKNIPDPEVLIRTGNTQRLSNFLLWQVAYAEIFFEKKLWPEFATKDLNKIMKKFSNIKRNFGNI
jgi:undecaprenyl diphosphate synthase